MTSAPPRLILIQGPTASGKSHLALELAAARPSVIINADAMQIYQGLPILTAQPSAEDKAACPHALYETLDASENGSAGVWREGALRAIDDALAQDRTPILVGGTGLYFDILLDGIADIPPVPAATHDETCAAYAAQGEAAFREALSAHDPAAAARIVQGDRQRLIRATEVWAATGKTLSFWQAQGKKGGIAPRFALESHRLAPARAALYEACDARFLRMMEQGALAEVEALLARALSPDLPAMKIIGVRELGAYLAGTLSKETAIAKTQQATRNYAKRQLTWLRRGAGAILFG